MGEVLYVHFGAGCTEERYPELLDRQPIARPEPSSLPDTS